MAYGTPADPVGGTIITVAYAVSNILNPLRWLRLMTGNADPPGSSYVVVSDSTTGTSWRKVPGDALAAGAVVSHLGYTPVNRGGDTITGSLTVAGGIGTTTGTFSSNVGISGTLGVSGPVTFTSSVGIGGNVGISGTLGVTGAGTFSNDLGVGATLSVGSAGTFGAAIQATRVLTTVSDAVTPPYTAHANQASVPCPNVKAESASVADAATTATTAANLAGVTATATPTPNKIPIADASGKLDDWVTAVTPGAYVPSGLIAAFETAAAIASGWARYSAADGRMLVGAGTTFSTTFTEATDYGSAWSFTPLGSVTIVIATHSATRRNANIAFGAGTDNVEDDHGHGITSQTFTGSATTWAIPSRAVVYAKKS